MEALNQWLLLSILIGSLSRVCVALGLSSSVSTAKETNPALEIGLLLGVVSWICLIVATFKCWKSFSDQRRIFLIVSMVATLLALMTSDWIVYRYRLG